MLNLRQTVLSHGAALTRPARLLLTVFALCLCSASNAAAEPRTTLDCSAIRQRQSSLFGYYWEYVPNNLHESGTSAGDTQCWQVSSFVSGATMSCYGWAGVELGWGSLSWSHTVTASDPGSSSQWTASLLYDFDDPNNSSYNQLTVKVLLWRNGSIVQQTTLVQRLGSSGIDEYCQQASASVTPAVGDVIEINISGSSFTSGTHVRVTDVHLTRI